MKTNQLAYVEDSKRVTYYIIVYSLNGMNNLYSTSIVLNRTYINLLIDYSVLVVVYLKSVRHTRCSSTFSSKNNTVSIILFKEYE